jgi:hypothetical protein
MAAASVSNTGNSVSLELSNQFSALENMDTFEEFEKFLENVDINVQTEGTVVNPTVSHTENVDNRKDNADFQLPKSQLRSSAKAAKRKEHSPNHSPPHTKPRLSLSDDEPIMRTIYVEGLNFNLAADVKSKPFKYQLELESKYKPVESLTPLFKTGNIRVVCKSKEQKQLFITDCKTICNKQVKVTEPYCVQRLKPDNTARQSTSNIDIKYKKGVITGYTDDYPCKDLATTVGAVWAKRLTKFVNGQEQETTAVLFAFPEDKPMPDVVNIGFILYKIKPYIPTPVRCTNCQQFTHRTEDCQHSKRCSRCGDYHTFKDCTKTDPNEFACVNCHGRHSAAFRGCPVYLEKRETLKIAAVNNLSYRDAITKYKEIEEQRQIESEREQQRAAQRLTTTAAVASNNTTTDTNQADTQRRESVSTSGPRKKVPRENSAQNKRQTDLAAGSQNQHISNATEPPPPAKQTKTVSCGTQTEPWSPLDDHELKSMLHTITTVLYSTMRQLNETNPDSASQSRLLLLVKLIDKLKSPETAKKSETHQPSIFTQLGNIFSKSKT